MRDAVLVASCLVWGGWVFLEAWRGRSTRTQTLLALGGLILMVLGGSARARGSDEPLGAVGVILWIPSLAGFAAGRLLLDRKEFPRGLEWLVGPVEAVASLAGLLASMRPRPAVGVDAPAAAPGDLARREALEQVLDLESRNVGEIMISRSELAALPETATVAEWIEIVRTKWKSILPVYKENLDNVTGIVSIRELLGSRAADETVGRYVRPVAFVPETKRCNELLRQLWTSGEHVAMVVDEFGGVAGMAGREDLLEILVGDLLEESDTEGARIFRVDGSTWVADGHFRIADFNDRFGVTLPEVGYETLSGLFLERLARIPQVGERLTFGDVTLQVVARDERRVKTLRIQTPPGPAGRRATGAGS